MSPRGAQRSASRTIKSSQEIQEMFGGAKRFAHPLLIALIARTPEGRGRLGRVAFVAGKRLGNAVMRNRCKRVLREAVRRADGPWPGWDLVLIAREATASASVERLDGGLESILHRSGIRSEPL